MSRYTAYLSPIAEHKLDTLLEFLENKWGNKAKHNFLEELESKIYQIEIFPNSCPKISIFGGLYKAVITEQTSIFYRIKGYDIEILTLTDNRQDPKAILKELKSIFK